MSTFSFRLPERKNTLKELSKDRSARVLLITNIVIIIIAIVEKWRPEIMMLIYWGQGAIIGWFNFWRILKLKNFSTRGFKINNRNVEPTPKTKIKTGFFFLLHYGIFNLAYLGLIAGFASQYDISTRDYHGILLCVIIFFANHWYSHRYNLKQDLKSRPNIGTMMLIPYVRIIPMQLTILAAGLWTKDSSLMTLVIFLLLKTVADLITHSFEHTIYTKKDPQK